MTTKEEFAKRWFERWNTAQDVSHVKLIGELYDAAIAPRDERMREKDRTVTVLKQDLSDQAYKLRLCDERLAEKDKTIATLSLQVDMYQGKAEPESLPPVPGYLSCRAIKTESMGDVDILKAQVSVLIETVDMASLCLRAIYKRLEVKP